MDINKLNIILASKSPSRKLLFDRAGIDVEVIVSGVNEDVPDSYTPKQTVEELAKRKAEAVHIEHKDRIVVAADSVVSIDGKIIGKQHSDEESREMLRYLSGRTHKIYTGVCIIVGNKKEVFSEQTDVTFYELSDEEIEEYIATGEPRGKAGSYGIEGIGITLVKGINGDYANVVGIPLAETIRRLKKML